MTNDKNQNIPSGSPQDQDYFHTPEVPEELTADAHAVEIEGLLLPEEVQQHADRSAFDTASEFLPEDGQDALLSNEEFKEALERTRELPTDQIISDMTLDNIWTVDGISTADHAVPAQDIPELEAYVPEHREAPFMDDSFRDAFGENGEALAAVFEAVDHDAQAAAASAGSADPALTDDALYHERLDQPALGTEIFADEHAISSAGLTHPADAEVDRILSEARVFQDQEENVQELDMLFQQEEAEEEHSAPETFAQIMDPPQSSSDEYDIHIPDYEDINDKKDEPVPEDAPALPKRRPKMKKGYGLLGIPHILSTVVWLAITVAIGFSLGRMIWVCAAEVLAFGRPDRQIMVTVSDGDNIEMVASKLKNAGLIKYPELFKLYAQLTDAEADISAGTFTLNSKYDYHALVNAMTYHSSAREEAEVMIPEGYTCAQIFALLEEKGVCTVAELEEYAANGALDDYWFMEGVVRGDRYCLEGYLFPDTYRFYTNDEPENVLEKFLDNFDVRFTDIMKEKLEPLNERLAAILSDRGYTQEYIDAHRITIRQIVIIASMIEKETANDAESYDVSSVIYNRLTNPKEYLYLNIDATIIYALGGNIDPVTGKTKPLTSEDLKLDSPYNTYTTPGLIPGPISNPGRNSLNAALDPTETDYYYYVYNPNTSKHLFSKTAEEHQKNVDYVRSLEENQETQ